MNSAPPPGDPGPDSYQVFLPNGLPVLRSAVEELVRSKWDDPFRQRALEIACAFEGSFRACGRREAAAIVHTLILMLDIDAQEAVMLGKHLERKLEDLLGRLERSLRADGEVHTG